MLLLVSWDRGIVGLGIHEGVIRNTLGGEANGGERKKEGVGVREG